MPILRSSSHALTVALFSALGTLGIHEAIQAQSPSDTPSPHIRVDAFGYRPTMAKVAVLRDPVVGSDAQQQGYQPGASLELRRTTDDSVVFSDGVTPWQAGDVDSVSGDKAWWFDFSSVETEGSFYVFDPSNGVASEPFQIGSEVYRAPVVAAVRAFYYQRCGTAKLAQHAGAGWSDTVCHHGPEQDTDCRSVLNPSAATGLDLHGGWHDAGDYNKYVNFARGPVHDLLSAYEHNPAFWTDDFGLPESGNGIPDILDEVRFELEWLLRMQLPNGSALHKVSVTDFSGGSPPSADGAPRRYAPPTASATISIAGVFAHAAEVFARIPATTGFAATLEQASRNAWDWLAANPNAIPSAYDNVGFANVDAEETPYAQALHHLAAAVYLFRLTGESEFRDFVDANHTQAHLFTWTWAAGWEAEIQDALARYAATPGASPTVAQAIRTQFDLAVTGPNQLGRVTAGVDPYRAQVGDTEYVWGSNRHKAQTGAMFQSLNRLGIAPEQARTLRDAAAGYLHYLHGVNPMGITFLSNAASLGAAKSVTQIYHGWFADGSVWDSSNTSQFGPPPGFLVGGPNDSYEPAPEYTGPTLSPPQGEPSAKSFLDWNADWPENSWQITEPHIPYQAAYVRLLAEFAIGQTMDLGLRAPTSLSAGTTAIYQVGGGTPGSLAAVFLGAERGRTLLNSPSLCVDLGLDAPGGLGNQLFLAGFLNVAGQVSWTFPLPTGFPDIDFLRYQAVIADTCPTPQQSAVVPW